METEVVMGKEAAATHITQKRGMFSINIFWFAQ